MENTTESGQYVYYRKEVDIVFGIIYIVLGVAGILSNGMWISYIIE